MPQDTRDAIITTLFKNKGHKSDYYNYRGISLLSMVGELFVLVVLYRLHILADSLPQIPVV